MQSNLKIACLVAAVIASTTSIASAQGGSTDRNGNAMGSEHVGSTGGTTSGSMHNGKMGTSGTTGMNRGGGEQGSPNGSPNAAPTSKQGPQGDASRDNDAPK
jgi:hypothetical protein